MYIAHTYIHIHLQVVVGRGRIRNDNDILNYEHVFIEKFGGER